MLLWPREGGGQEALGRTPSSHSINTPTRPEKRATSARLPQPPGEEAAQQQAWARTASGSLQVGRAAARLTNCRRRTSLASRRRARGRLRLPRSQWAVAVSGRHAQSPPIWGSGFWLGRSRPQALWPRPPDGHVMRQDGGVEAASWVWGEGCGRGAEGRWRSAAGRREAGAVWVAPSEMVHGRIWARRENWPRLYAGRDQVSSSYPRSPEVSSKFNVACSFFSRTFYKLCL